MKKIVLLLSVAFMAFTACTEQPAAKVKILAHRGNASTGSEFTTDENTLDALRRAQECNVDGIEFDVHLTADDQLVIRHDNKIADGLSCQGSTFEEVRAHVLPFGHQIPTLREWLEQAKQTPHIVQLLEIKSHKGDRENELIAKCLEVIRELDMLDQMYMLSFDPKVVDEVLRQEPNMKVVLNSSSLHHSLTPAEVKEKGYTVLAIEQVEGAAMLDKLEIDTTKKYALVFGNEVLGVDQAVVDICDGAIEIPQAGTKHSINVSVCGGVVLWKFFEKFINK